MRQSKITFFTSLGAGLEYYDYVIYSLMATFISQLYFPGENKTAALFATFFVLAISNIVRPIGAIVLGVLGDIFGRKNIFSHTLLWMALIAFLMGITPTFAVWGLAAAFIFGALRIMQGIIFGAELPGALTLLSEHVHTKKQGLHIGFMISSVGLGVSLASLVIWVLTSVLTEQQILAWGFRAPFIIGGVLALLGFYIRKHLPETPKFLAAKKSKRKISFSAIRCHWPQILNIIGLLLFPSCWVMFKLIFPVYLHDYYHFEWPDIYSAMTCGYVSAAIMLPFFGWFSDYIGQRFLIIAGSLVLIIFIFPMFNLLDPGMRWTLFAFIIFCQAVQAIMAASYFVLMPRVFKTLVRFTGTALSHNIVHTLAAMLPMLVNYIYGVAKKPAYLLWLFIALACLTIICTFLFKECDEEEFVSKENVDYAEEIV